MPLLEVLKQSRAMWLWLYENPGAGKYQYLSMIAKEEKPADILNLCYICHHHITNPMVGCEGNCPIKWGDYRPYACELIISPYYQWTEAESGSEEEHEAAGKIIDLHDEAIERCKKMLMRRLKSRLRYYYRGLLTAFYICPICHERMVVTRTGRKVCLNKINH